MRKHNSLNQVFFGKFVSAAFDHHNRVGCSGYDKFQVAFFRLLKSWESNKFSVDFSDIYARQRLVKRQIRHAKRERRRDNAASVCLVLVVC
jgi:hypothetical protein